MSRLVVVFITTSLVLKCPSSLGAGPVGTLSHDEWGHGGVLFRLAALHTPSSPDTLEITVVPVASAPDCRIAVTDLSKSLVATSDTVIWSGAVRRADTIVTHLILPSLVVGQYRFAVELRSPSPIGGTETLANGSVFIEVDATTSWLSSHGPGGIRADKINLLLKRRGLLGHPPEEVRRLAPDLAESLDAASRIIVEPKPTGADSLAPSQRVPKKPITEDCFMQDSTYARNTRLLKARREAESAGCPTA